MMCKNVHQLSSSIYRHLLNFNTQRIEEYLSDIKKSTWVNSHKRNILLQSYR